MAEDEKSAKSISRYVMERGSVVEIQCGENAALKFVSSGGSSESEVNLKEVSSGTPFIVRQSSLDEEGVRFEMADSATKEPKGKFLRHAGYVCWTHDENLDDALKYIDEF